MLDRVNDFLSSTFDNMPLAVLTIALLATPTLIYVIYRFASPSTSQGRSRTSTVPIALWVCPVCRSVNDLSSGTCYRCDLKVDDTTDLLIIDPITAKPIPLREPGPGIASPGVAVGPGIPLVATAPVLPTTPVSPAAPAPPSAPGVPVGPGATTGASARGAKGQPAIATAVGARRPFDPVPEPRSAATSPEAAPVATSAAPAPAPRADPAPSATTPSTPAASATPPDPGRAAAPRRPTVTPPPRIVVTSPPKAARATPPDEVGPTDS